MPEIAVPRDELAKPFGQGCRGLVSQFAVERVRSAKVRSTSPGWVGRVDDRFLADRRLDRCDQGRQRDRIGSAEVVNAVAVAVVQAGQDPATMSSTNV